MAEVITHFTLRVERSMQGLARLGAWIDEVSAALALPANAEYALRLCTEEAVANLVMHGAPGQDGAANDVTLRTDALPDVLRVTIEDTCAAFDPSSAAAPEPHTSLPEARVGGLGIHLMRQYAQTMEYQPLDGMNRLTLTIARHAAN